MHNLRFFALLLSLFAGSVYSEENQSCLSLMRHFVSKVDNEFTKDLSAMGFSDFDQKIIFEALSLKKEKVNHERVKDYLAYVLSLKSSDRKLALMDLDQLDEREMNSEFMKTFLKNEKKIQAKIASSKLAPRSEQKRYRELFYGCRAFTPNAVNSGAAREFKKFNLSLGLGTLAASYAYYNMDKDFNAEWFEKLGYDVGVTLLYSYVGGKIQTNAADTQLAKSLKSYFIGRVIGLTDVVIYDPLFNDEKDRARARLEQIKKDPINKAEIDKLMESYRSRGLYRKFKAEVIGALKKLPSGIGLGVKGQSIDENNVDWNNLTHADLDNPVVQDVLLAAAMAEIYQQKKGEWLETSDSGLDRYTFNSLFYGLQIPRSMAQTYITYQMLCMGQDNAKMSFAKAVLFNVTSNFIVNQALYGYRKEAIGN